MPITSLNSLAGSGGMASYNNDPPSNPTHGMVWIDRDAVAPPEVGTNVFTGLTDVPQTYAGSAGKIPVVNGTETGLEFLLPAPATTFKVLTDVPQSYAGMSGNIVAVNGPETGLEFVQIPYIPVDKTGSLDRVLLAPGSLIYIDFVNRTEVFLNVDAEPGQYEITVVCEGVIGGSGYCGFIPGNSLSASSYSIGSVFKSTEPYPGVISDGDVLIPIMTGYTTPDGVVSASSVYSTNYYAWYAFDNNGATRWHPSASSGWLQYEFPIPKVVTSYAITSSHDAGNQNPKDWTFYGSNDALTWTALSTITNQINWPVAETRTFTVVNITAYKYYRLDMLNTAGAGNLGVARLQMFGKPDRVFICNGLLNYCKMTVSTMQASKLIDLQSLGSLSAGVIERRQGTSVIMDTTTAWSDLGSLTFPVNQTGRVIVRRIV